MVRSDSQRPMLYGATLNLGPPIASLPYLFTDSLEDGCRRAADAGYQALDLLLPAPDSIPSERLSQTLAKYHLRLGALATGGAWFSGRLHLASPDAGIRAAAENFIAGLLQLAGTCRGAVIVGLVAGVIEPGVERAQALRWLEEGLDRLAGRADREDAMLLLEPLNRAETNLLNRLSDGRRVVERLGSPRLGLVADFYHLHREEQDVAGALRASGSFIHHIHVVDDNREAPGRGSLDFARIGDAVRSIGFSGCLSVEALPRPTEEEAARCAMEALRRWFTDSSKEAIPV